VIWRQALHASQLTGLDCLAVVVGGVSARVISFAWQTTILQWLTGQILVASNACQMFLLVYAVTLAHVT